MSRSAAALLVLVFVAVGACSSGSDDPEPTAKTVLPKVVKPQLPDPISAADAEVLKLADVETKRVNLSSPDWLATTSGALWVRLDSGQVVRLDPVTGAIRKRIDPSHGEGLCQAFGASGDTAVFSCAYNGLIERIDPAKDEVVAELKATFSSDQGHLVTADDKVWVMTGDGDEITPIDPRDNSLGKPIDLGSYCLELGGGGTVVYAVCTNDGLVLRVDVVRRKVTHRLALTDPRTIAVSSSGVFVSFEGASRSWIRRAWIREPCMTSRWTSAAASTPSPTGCGCAQRVARS